MFLQPRQAYLPEAPRDGLQQEVIRLFLHCQQPAFLFLFQRAFAEDEAAPEAFHRRAVHLRPVGFHARHHAVGGLPLLIAQGQISLKGYVSGQCREQTVECQFHFPPFPFLTEDDVLQQEHGTYLRGGVLECLTLFVQVTEHREQADEPRGEQAQPGVAHRQGFGQLFRYRCLRFGQGQFRFHPAYYVFFLSGVRIL